MSIKEQLINDIKSLPEHTLQVISIAVKEFIVLHSNTETTVRPVFGSGKGQKCDQLNCRDSVTTISAILHRCIVRYFSAFLHYKRFEKFEPFVNFCYPCSLMHL